MVFGPAIRHAQVRYFIDHDSDHRKTVFVAGMGRSGTTWLAELLNFRNEYRFIFEPFDPQRVALASGFEEHTYLREDDARRQFIAPARAIVTGMVREHFVDQHNRKLICSRRIVKEVHANLLLRWLYRQFPGMPLVMIVRHPFAVAASRQATAEDKDLAQNFLAQTDLVVDYLRPYVDVMLSCVTPFERQIAAWCIETGVPFSQFRANELCVVFYEHLVTDPLGTMRRVWAHLGKPFDARIAAAVARPSITTHSPVGLEARWRAGADRILDAWKDQVSTTQLRRGLRLLDAFDVGGIYDHGAMPLVKDAPLGRPFGYQAASRGFESVRLVT